MPYTCNTSAVPSFAQVMKQFRTHPDRYDAIIIIRDNIKKTKVYHHHHHHHVQEGLGLIPVSCILKMKLVPPSLPRSSYVSSSFWFIL